MPRQSTVHDVWSAVVDRIEGEQPCALATVLESDGSTPVKAGAKALLSRDGLVLVGTVGGGAVEAGTQERTVEALRSGQAIVADFSLQGTTAECADAICGGAMRVLIDPTVRHHLDAYHAAACAVTDRRRGVLMTQLDNLPRPTPVPHWIGEQDFEAWDGFPAQSAIRGTYRRERCTLVMDDASPSNARRAAFIEPVLPPPRLLIVGGGHVGQAVARQAAEVGFEVSVLDDRDEFTRPELFPKGTLTRCAGVPQALGQFDFTPDTYVVLVSRGHQHDREALAVCLRKPTAYLGMIGSKRKVALVRRSFLDSGTNEAEFDRVYAPIGLDIGAVTVPEIAASIVSQLVSVRRHGTASRMPRV